jgi:glycosyltransferase involved in cell wall biosynthesis
VSIILPAYNAADFLATTLRSALSQTFTDFEILLLDNASTDDTQGVATSFTDPRLRYYRNETNLGYAGNVELGRGLAGAPFVVVFNADDVWDPDYLAKAVAVLQSNPRLAFVHAHINLMDEHGVCYGSAVTDWSSITRGHDAFLNCFLAGFSSPTMLIRNEVLRTVAPLPTGEPWGKVADCWLFLQLCLRGDVGYIAEPLMRYRVHSASMMFESYADGSFFRRRLANVRDAFSWPETTIWVSDGDRRTVTTRIALQAATILPIIRNVHPRLSLMKGFAQIVRAVPRAIMYPTVWVRFAYGLLPRATIAALRTRKRREWAARHPSAPPLSADTSSQSSTSGPADSRAAVGV